MAHPYKPNGRKIYRLEFKDQHDCTRNVSLRTNDKGIAEGVARMIQEDAAFLRAGMAPRNLNVTGIYLGLVSIKNTKDTWKGFRKRYEEEYLESQRPSSRAKATMVLDIFEQVCKPKNIAAVEERMLSSFAKHLRSREVIKHGKKTEQKGLAPWTIKNYLGALHTVLRWAVQQKLLVSIPNFPTVRVPKFRPQPIDEADWLKLVEQAPNALWRAYLLCGWLGGLRLNEARCLRRQRCEEWPWLDLAGDRIILPARFVKTEEDQWIPLHPDLRRELAELPDQGDEIFPFRSRKGHGPLSRAGISQFVRLLAKRAGVKLSMHRLRKGFGCRVATQLGKGNAPVLHRLMRHTSMQITMDFYASVDDALHDAIRQLDQSKPVRPFSTEESAKSPSATSRPSAGPSAGEKSGILDKADSTQENVA